MLMQKLLKVLVLIIYCIGINIYYTRSFRSLKYQFIDTKHGIGELALTGGSIIKHA